MLDTPTISKVRWIYSGVIVCVPVGAVAGIAWLIRQPWTLLNLLTMLVLVLLLLIVCLVLVFRWVTPPASAFMLYTYVKLQRDDKHTRLLYQWVPIQAISPPMCIAAILAEDFAFPIHYGFDWYSLRMAYTVNRQSTSRRPVRGGSTISQQLVKNLFLWPSKSYIRKGVEFLIALLLEGLWPKKRILEVYLNTAQFGELIFGVEAASMYFLGKHAAQLTLEDASLLAAVLPNPIRNRVDQPGPAVRMRQAIILNGMKRLSPPYLSYIQHLGLA